jgi:hypothetical protein
MAFLGSTQIYYVISWKRYLFPCNSIQRNRATSQGLFHYDVRRIRITIRIRVVVVQKSRIWVMVRVMVGFFLKALVSCICLHGKIPLKDMQFSNLTAAL